MLFPVQDVQPEVNEQTVGIVPMVGELDSCIDLEKRRAVSLLIYILGMYTNASEWW
jgi:hypothetical protein